jgi:Uncharacterised nucleotidyltransferase
MPKIEGLAAYLREPFEAAAAIPLDIEICGVLREQGVGPLVYRALRARQFLDAQPAGVREELERLTREEGLLEPFRRDEAARVLDALATAGVHGLVFKGTALAYACYPEPSLRPRLDTDLLIRRADVQMASIVFERLGCTRAHQTSGDHVSHQMTYISARHGLQIAFDVHWKLSNPQPFADLFSFEELERESISLPGLGPGARTLCDVHALLVACLHRVAHHYGREFLLYLYDIDRLARRLNAQGWDSVVADARAKRIRQVTLCGLERASSLLGTPVPDRVAQALASSPEDEPTAAYLAAGFRKIDILRADLRELAWRDRLRLVREHLFPAPAFILRSYGHTSPVLLPFLYFARIIGGASAWFRPLR